MTFQEAKEKLAERCSDISHFTEEFYDTYVTEARQATMNRINGYQKDEYVFTKRSAFYLQNSSAYCAFLEVMGSAKCKYMAELYRGGEYMATVRFTADDDVTASRIGNHIMEQHGCDGIEIARR